MNPDRRTFIVSSLAAVGAAAMPEVSVEPHVVMCSAEDMPAAAKLLEACYPGSGARVEWLPLLPDWNEQEVTEYACVPQSPIVIVSLNA